MFELGWKYDHAYIDREKYKEGRFILEVAKLVKIDWEGDVIDVGTTDLGYNVVGFVIPLVSIVQKSQPSRGLK